MRRILKQTAKDKVNEILSYNQDKNFVQRILRPKDFPVLPAGENPHKDVVHTHLMADGEMDGRYFVYPTVFMELDGRLNKIDDPDKAFYKAIFSNEFIEFPSQEEASWFAHNYKAVWD